MQPSDFADWTREDRMEFENIRQIAFQQTEKELQESRNKLINTAKEKLLVYWIKFTGEETDFSELREKYILWDGTKKNPDMQERLWNKERLQEIINDKIQNHNTLDWFMNFVLQYE